MSKVCDRCHALIKFVRLDTGKAIPIDPIATPDDKGNVAARRGEGGTLVGYVVSRAKPLRAEYQTYMPHFKSCKPATKRVTATERTPNLFDEEV